MIRFCKIFGQMSTQDEAVSTRASYRVHLQGEESVDVIFTKDFMLTKDLLFWKFVANFKILASERDLKS